MFEIAAIVGLNLQKKIEWNLIHQHQPEIINIFPEKLLYSPLIVNQVGQCFPEGVPLIIEANDQYEIYPKDPHQKYKRDVCAQLHNFNVQLNEEKTLFCYSLTFYETAYIQNIERLPGKRERMLVQQLDTSMKNRKNGPINNQLFNNYIQVFVQKSIVITCDTDDTGCEASFVQFINRQLKIEDFRMNKLCQSYIQSIQDNGPQNADKKHLIQLLCLTQKCLITQKILPYFDLYQLLDYLTEQKQNNQQKVIVEKENLNENVTHQIVRSMDFQQLSKEESNKVMQSLDNLMNCKEFKYPKLKKMKKRNLQNKSVPLMLNTNVIKDVNFSNQKEFKYKEQSTMSPIQFNSESQVQRFGTQKRQDFSFHNNSTKAKDSKIFKSQVNTSLVKKMPNFY